VCSPQCKDMVIKNWVLFYFIFFSFFFYYSYVHTRLGISLKEKSVKVGIYPWQVAKSMHYGILIQFYFYIRF
jgi:hypothetical protein